jgi:hypothetical protein
MKMINSKISLNIYKYSYYFKLNRFLIKRLFKTFKYLGIVFFQKYNFMKWILLFKINSFSNLTTQLMKIYFHMFLKNHKDFVFKKYNQIMPLILSYYPKINFFKYFQRNFVLFGFFEKKTVMFFLRKFYNLKLIPYIFVPLNLLKCDKVTQYYPLQQFNLNQIFGFNFENKQELLNLYLLFVTRFFYYLFLLFFQMFFKF